MLRILIGILFRSQTLRICMVHSCHFVNCLCIQTSHTNASRHQMCHWRLNPSTTATQISVSHTLASWLICWVSSPFQSNLKVYNSTTLQQKKFNVLTFYFERWKRESIFWLLKLYIFPFVEYISCHFLRRSYDVKSPHTLLTLKSSANNFQDLHSTFLFHSRMLFLGYFVHILSFVDCTNTFKTIIYLNGIK